MGFSFQNHLRQIEKKEEQLSFCFPMSSKDKTNNGVNLTCLDNNCYGTINDFEPNTFSQLNFECSKKGCRMQNKCYFEEICENCFNITLICFNGHCIGGPYAKNQENNNDNYDYNFNFTNDLLLINESDINNNDNDNNNSNFYNNDESDTLPFNKTTIINCLDDLCLCKINELLDIDEKGDDSRVLCQNKVCKFLTEEKGAPNSEPQKDKNKKFILYLSLCILGFWIICIFLNFLLIFTCGNADSSNCKCSCYLFYVIFFSIVFAPFFIIYVFICLCCKIKWNFGKFNSIDPNLYPPYKVNIRQPSEMDKLTDFGKDIIKEPKQGQEESDAIKKYTKIELDDNNTLNFENILINLEESKINFINIDGASCYQSSTLQGFVHLIYPKAIRKLNEEKIKKGESRINSLDELKNNIIFNDMVIDILKEINIKENERKQNLNNSNFSSNEIKNNTKNFEANKIFDKFPPENGRSQGLLNEYDCNKLHERLIYGGKINDSNFSNNDSVSDEKDTSAKIININKKTIISEILKIKIENDDNTYGNLVLKFNETDIKDSCLNIIKLIKNCPQLKNTSNSLNHKKITEISDIIYIIIDRVENSEGITKKFVIDEKLYFDKSSQNFKENCTFNYSLYELQFIIYHSSNSLSSGHYFAYQKIKGDWYYFNDTNSDYAKKQNPPLSDTNEGSDFPVIMYFALIKK